MDNRQLRTYQALVRVHALSSTREFENLPPMFYEMRTAIGESITRLREFHGTQSSSSSTLSGAAPLDHLRKRLRRERMMPLVKVARPLLKFAPGTATALRVPHARAGSTEVADAAIRLFQALKKHHKLLASAGYPKDFLLEMRSEADVIAAAVERSEKARQKRARATSSLAAELRKALGYVTVMEGILAPRLAADPALGARWRFARRITARIGRPKKRRGAPDATQPQLKVV